MSKISILLSRRRVPPDKVCLSLLSIYVNLIEFVIIIRKSYKFRLRNETVMMISCRGQDQGHSKKKKFSDKGRMSFVEDLKTIPNL